MLQGYYFAVETYNNRFGTNYSQDDSSLAEKDKQFMRFYSGFATGMMGRELDYRKDDEVYNYGLTMGDNQRAYDE